MSVIALPFVCLAVGIIIGLKLPHRFILLVEPVGNFALIALMLAIGANIGINDTIVKSIGIIGLQCVAIICSAVCFSVLFVFLLEKTVLPLEALRRKIIEEHMETGVSVPKEERKKTSPLVWLIPVCVIAGAGTGYFLFPDNLTGIIDQVFILSLAILYMSVGVGLVQNKEVIGFIKLLGWKVIFISLAIFAGSLFGGAIAGWILGLPLHVPVLSAAGMGYYSITGAYMAKVYGAGAGTYGFLVNVLRDFLTILLLPALIRLSKGAPIAAGAAGNMDTMLVPVTKSVGVELGVVALITGTILTFVVPLALPVLSQLLPG